MLSAFGYHVGRTGAKPTDRHTRLSALFESQSLPRADSRMYVSEWGSPKSHKRLSKMAETIAALTRNAKLRKGNAMIQSIEDWEEDLRWLRLMYHSDSRFGWPGTDLS